MTPRKIVICEDHALFADGLRVLLSVHPRFQLTGQARNEAELLSLLNSNAIDILLLDLNLGPTDGFSILTKVRPLFPQLKVVIVTMYEDESLIEKSRKLGANGYLLKNANTQELIDALDKLEDTDFYLPPSLQKLRNNHAQSRVEFIEKMKLTKREIEIICLFAKGQSPEQISEQLFLSLHTVRTHKKNIMKKLGLNQGSDLVRFAFENHMI